MPFRPITQTSSDGTKSINFSDGGRWDGGTGPEDKYFKGVLQAPTKTCYEKFEPDTFEEVEVETCNDIIYIVQEEIGKMEVCTISATEVPALIGDDTPGVLTSIADDFSQFDENQPISSRTLPLPYPNQYPGKRTRHDFKKNLRSYGIVAQDVNNSENVVLKQHSDGSYLNGTWPHYTTFKPTTEAIVTTSRPPHLLPVQSGISVASYSSVFSSYLTLNKKVTLPSGERISIRQAGVESHWIHGDPPPPPPKPLPPEITPEDDPGIVQDDPGQTWTCTCEVIPQFADVEKKRTVCKKHTVLKRITGAGGYVPCAWPQDTGDATEGSPAVLTRSIAGLNERSGKPLRYRNRDDGTIEIKFDPNLDITNIIGSTLSLDKTPTKVLNLRVKVKFKARKIVFDNMEHYYRPRTHLPLESFKNKMADRHSNTLIDTDRARTVHYDLFGGNGSIQTVFSMIGRAGNKINPSEYGKQCVHPLVPLQGRPIGLSVFDHQLLTDAEISTINRLRKATMINAPFYTTTQFTPGFPIAGPYLTNTGGRSIRSYPFHRRYLSTSSFRTFIYGNHKGGEHTVVHPPTYYAGGQTHLPAPEFSQKNTMYPWSYYPNYGYIDFSNRIHDSYIESDMRPGVETRNPWGGGKTLAIHKNNQVLAPAMNSFNVANASPAVKSITQLGQIPDPAATRDEMIERYLPGVNRSASVTGTDLPSWARDGSGQPNEYWLRACGQGNAFQYTGPKDIKKDVYPKMYSAQDEWTFWAEKMADRGFTLNSSSFESSEVSTEAGYKADGIREIKGEFDMSAYNCTELTLRFAGAMNLDYRVEWYWEVVDYNAAYGTIQSPILEGNTQHQRRTEKYVQPVGDCQRRL